ncbi:major facilitator superfamily domain-containing protein [Mrakia frigida]|uniref:major facilitator superfamily domain-containing protein n=1 Tax=Mrakia frigida TaxID=29902 RepID=UPI003FCC1683
MTATSTSPLLPPPSAPPASSYGSRTEDGHEHALRESDEEEAIKSEPLKAHKEFKEIALLCFGLWTSVYCAALNASITANLQIEIGSYFKAGHLASWLGGSYLLGVAALTPLWGRLSNIIGRRSAIITAMVFFTSGTLGCAISPSMGVILFSRLVAGCGGGGLLTVTAIIISDLVSLQDRGLYQGYVNLLFGAGSASGAIFGGAVADRFGWRWAFGMQVLPLLVSFTLILWKVHVPAPINAQTPWQLFKRIDWLGAFLIVTSVTSLMLSLSLHSASSLPWSHPAVYLLLALFLASTIGFWACEQYHAAEPLIPMSLLTMRTPSLVLTAFLLLTMTGFARIFMLPLYLHVVRGYNGSKTGLILLPSSIVGSAGSLFAGWYMRKTGAYKRLTIICSVIPMISSLSFLTWGVGANVHRVWIEMALASFGGGVLLSSLPSARNTVSIHQITLAQILKLTSLLFSVAIAISAS